MRRMKQVLAMGVLAAALAASSGCTTGRATGLGVQYSQGYSQGVVQADFERVREAARAVFNEREMYVVDEEMDRPRPRITARTAADRRVRVMLERRTPNRTEMWVRYGIFGDRNHGTDLFLRIAEVAEADEQG